MQNKNENEVLKILTSNGFETTTWNGVHCHIDLQTGKTTKLGVRKQMRD